MKKIIERITCQKKFILDYLKSVKTHPSAEEIYLKIKEELPRISRGTVYRILNNFTQKGETQIIVADGLTHFDGDASSHAHFICQKCHKIFDISDVCQECNVLKYKKIKVGKIKNYQVYFYGNCKKCRYKECKFLKG